MACCMLLDSSFSSLLQLKGLWAASLTLFKGGCWMFEMNILSSSSWIAPEVEDLPHVAAHALAQAAVQQVFGRKTIVQYRIIISWQCGDPENLSESEVHHPGSDTIKIFFHRVVSRSEALWVVLVMDTDVVIVMQCFLSILTCCLYNLFSLLTGSWNQTPTERNYMKLYILILSWMIRRLGGPPGRSFWNGESLQDIAAMSK